jgi:uncharacterized protein YggU (UPF0235/DUF167 family)
MILHIRVIPKASRNLVVKENGSLKAYLTKPAKDNLANTQLIGLLSQCLYIKKYQIKIIKPKICIRKMISSN